ncbi:MAG: hypothetical protein JO250_22545 [Armatimonadetes bacterium]|nr:hypothetical protein [Armatimonadota bacterium]
MLLTAPAQARPKVLVVLADHLTLGDVTRPGLSGFAALAGAGHVALMSPGLAHGPDPVANVYATLGAGDSIAAGDIAQGRMADAVRVAGLQTALIGHADGDDTGPYRPAEVLLPFPDMTYDPTVPAPASPGGRRTDPARLWVQTEAALDLSDLVLVHFGDFDRLERENQDGDLLPAAYAAHRRRFLRALDRYLVLALTHPWRNAPDGRRLFFIVPAPPFAARAAWDRLTPLIDADLAGRAVRPASLTSDTTQTPGLVAARDLAPTLLDVLQIPRPLQMTGAPWRPSGPEKMDDAVAALRRLDRQTRLNQQAQNPLFWGIGLIAPLIIFPCLALYLTGRLARSPHARRLALYGVRLLAAWPLALLLAPLTGPATVGLYLAVIALLTALIALLTPPALIFSVTSLVLVADGLAGTRLVSQSVLSAYALAGIRFYGIGNEYMGLLLGGALLAAATTRLTSPARPSPRRQAADPLPRVGEGGEPRRAGRGGAGTLLWFALVTVVLSCPAFGAKAGGAVTAVATFALAWLRLRGVRLRWYHLAAGVIAGFALVFLWAALGDWLHLRRTHLETAVGALEGGRFGYIVGVSARKVGLAVRVFGHPGTLLGILGLGLLGLAARTVLWPQVAAYYALHPRLAAVSEAGLWGCGVCVLFNDSGIVAAILLLMCLILPVLHGLWERPCAFSPSTSATSASASPSATP